VAGNQFWTQNSPGVLDRSELDAFFGYAMTWDDSRGGVDPRDGIVANASFKAVFPHLITLTAVSPFRSGEGA
jgi:hypothetical protein